MTSRKVRFTFHDTYHLTYADALRKMKSYDSGRQNSDRQIFWQKEKHAKLYSIYSRLKREPVTALQIFCRADNVNFHMHSTPLQDTDKFDSLSTKQSCYFRVLLYLQPCHQASKMAVWLPIISLGSQFGKANKKLILWKHILKDGMEVSLFHWFHRCITV